MKVMCINNSGAEMLTEGNTYMVIKVFTPIIVEYGYLLEEVKSTHYTGAFLASRFIECSEEAETETIREYQTEPLNT